MPYELLPYFQWLAKTDYHMSTMSICRRRSMTCESLRPMPTIRMDGERCSSVDFVWEEAASLHGGGRSSKDDGQYQRDEL